MSDPRSLFVGGPHDGQRHAVLFGDEAKMSGGVYTPRPIVSAREGAVNVIFVIEDMSTDIAIERLIEGYRP